MATRFYKQDAGKFQLHDSSGEQDQVVHSSEAVAVAYVQLPDRLHIFTHGTAEGMAAWVKAHNAVCKPEHKATLRTFDQNSQVTTINQAIEDPKFLATLI